MNLTISVSPALFRPDAITTHILNCYYYNQIHWTYFLFLFFSKNLYFILQVIEKFYCSNFSAYFLALVFLLTLTGVLAALTASFFFAFAFMIFFMRLELIPPRGIVFKTIASTIPPKKVNVRKSRLELETLGHEPIMIPFHHLLICVYKFLLYIYHIYIYTYISYISTVWYDIYIYM